MANIVDFGSQYKRTGGFPLVAEDVKETLADLTAYLSNANENHYNGQLIAVTNDTTNENNGLYIVSGTAENRFATQILDKVRIEEVVEGAVGGLTGAMVLKGNVPSTEWTVAQTNHEAGWTFVVTTAGTYVGEVCEAGDTIICKTSGKAANNGDWFVVQKNVDGAVVGPGSAAEAEVAVFDGPTGKRIKSGGKTLAQVLSEAKALSNATGTLGVEHGGTGATTLGGAKENLGITALEDEVSDLKDGTIPAKKAESLSTPRDIDGVDFDGTGDVSHFVTCSQEGGLSAVTVSLPGFKLKEGSRVSIFFENPITLNSGCTLDVSGTGAKPIEIADGEGIPESYRNIGYHVVEFVYNGTSYLFTSFNKDTVELGNTVAEAPGTASAGTSKEAARADHVHPLQKTVAGNAGTATKLQTGRTVNVLDVESGGETIPLKTFDGSSHVVNHVFNSAIFAFNTSALPSVIRNYATLPFGISPNATNYLSYSTVYVLGASYPDFDVYELFDRTHRVSIVQGTTEMESVLHVDFQPVNDTSVANGAKLFTANVRVDDKDCIAVAAYNSGSTKKLSLVFIPKADDGIEVVNNAIEELANSAGITLTESNVLPIGFTFEDLKHLRRYVWDGTEWLYEQYVF